RDFRGDTVHPSTLEILSECGLSDEFAALPQQKVQTLEVEIGGEVIPAIDFKGLAPFDHLVLVPQWDLLDLIAREANKFQNFRLLMEHEATALLYRDGKVAGVQVRLPGGELTVHAELVVGCDGRRSM